MPRPLRIEFPGAIYHVMSRGDRRENIFYDDVDRREFVKTLADACLKTGWQIHAYCLMGNHFHLVLETPSASLSTGMHWLLSTYTIRLNRRRKLTGHVFGGRFKAVLVEPGGGYLKTACDYVHLNPVRAGLVRSQERLASYPWSSFPWYLSARKHRPEWMRVDRLLGEHGIRTDAKTGLGLFEKRMESRRATEETPDQFKPLRRGWCLGGADFRKEMLAKAEGQSGEAHSGELWRESALEKGRRILQEELKLRKWTQEELACRRKSDKEKLAIASRIRRETILPMKTIAQMTHLGTSKSANTKLRKWMEQEKTNHEK